MGKTNANSAANVWKSIPPLHFEEESRLVQSGNITVSAADAAAAGAACGMAVKKSGGGKFLVAHGGSVGACSLAHAFAAGAASAGTDCVFAGEASAPRAAFVTKQLGCSAGCHILTEITPVFRLYAHDGLTLYRSTEEDIERELCRSERIPYSHYGSISEFSGSADLYTCAVGSILKGSPEKAYADVYSSSEQILKDCTAMLRGKNEKSGERIAFRISADGKKLSVYSESAGYVFQDKLIMLCCKELFEKGRDVSVCGTAPRSLELLASKYGRRVCTCGRNICTAADSPSKKCTEARRLASEQLFMHDAQALMLSVLEILRKRRITLAQAVKQLPEFACLSRYIPVNKPSELLRRLCAVTADGDSPNGVLADGAKGRVIVRPVRTGMGVMLNVESYAMEAALELCDYYCGIIASDKTANGL